MRKKETTAVLALGALGIVYGDIGTSPLYAFNEVFFGNGNMNGTPENIIGVTSLIFWIFVFIVSIKYVFLVLLADNRGEGGVFSIMSILENAKSKRLGTLVILLMFSAGLLFGEGIITPAISVLSAVEGLNLVFPDMHGLVIPLTVLIIAGIFFFQKKGTGRMGKIYGPIMLLWFVVIALLGMRQIMEVPEIFFSLVDPRSALSVLFSLSWSGLAFLIGAVFLVITGSEALYADLGHFGKKAIRVGWFFVVFPALFLNYAGQAAFLLRGLPVQESNLFYSIVPASLILPMVILATLATSIASVALIFGAYSIVSQAIALNLLPRLKILHTSESVEGQIYVPAVNWLLCAGSISLVLIFGSATKLASAYGFAVSSVMFITSIALYHVARSHWKWSRLTAIPIFSFFILIDAGFVFANSAKFLEGGYIPFLLGCGIFFVILTWRWGRKLLRLAYDRYVANRDMAWLLHLKNRIENSDGTLHDERTRSVVLLDRAVVFVISRPIFFVTDKVPVKVRVFLKRRGAMPKHIILLHIRQKHIPYTKHRYKITDFQNEVFAVQATFGFMENPDASSVLRELYQKGVFGQKFCTCVIETSTDELIIDADVPMARRLLAKFFRFLIAFSVPRYRYFGLSGPASVGLSRTIVPVRLSRAGVRVEIPEFPLSAEGECLDPDTKKERTLGYSLS